MISLFRAYKTATNEEFLHAVDYWKNEWNSGTLKTAEQLMDRAEKKFVEIRDLGTWGKRSDKDDQIIALTTQMEALKKGGSNNSSHDKRAKSNPIGNRNKKTGPKWKNDRSLSSGNELKKNGKVYKWCTGPGHNGIGMWVTHEPGKCTKSNYPFISSKRDSESKLGYDRQALTTILKQKGNLTDDEIESKVEAILAVMES